MNINQRKILIDEPYLREFLPDRLEVLAEFATMRTLEIRKFDERDRCVFRSRRWVPGNVQMFANFLVRITVETEKVATQDGFAIFADVDLAFIRLSVETYLEGNFIKISCRRLREWAKSQLVVRSPRIEVTRSLQ